MSAQIRFQEGRLQLGGVIHFENAQSVLEQGLSLISQAGSLVIIDVSGLESGGSIDVAVFVQWLRAAQKAGKQLRFDHVSARLQAVIRVSGLKDALPLLTP